MTSILTAIITAVPWWVRLIFALAMLVPGGLILYFVNFRLGFIMIVMGFILLCFSGRSQSEKNGYNF